eukprot:12429569-Alexandrium_andersonii.AAC.1
MFQAHAVLCHSLRCCGRRLIWTLACSPTSHRVRTFTWKGSGHSRPQVRSFLVLGFKSAKSGASSVAGSGGAGGAARNAAPKP